MTESTLTIENLLNAGLHFGHQTKRWNPKMKRFIHSAQNGIYIIDLQQTLVRLKIAQEFLRDTVLSGREVLFVGTKKQARTIFQDAAETAGQPYVIHRWLGGMLTNNQTVRLSVKRMGELQKLFEDEAQLKKLSKKEQSALRREMVKLERNLTGVKDMHKLPGALFVVDINREKLAIAEAERLNIPVVALVDTNTNPELVEYPIPGNDDSIRSLSLIANELGSTIAEAHEEFTAKKAAEDKARREKEAADKAAADKARAERKAKEDEERKKRAKVLEKLKKEKAAAEKAKKEAAAKEKAEKAAAKAEVKEAAAPAEAKEEKAPVAEKAAAPAEVKAEAPAKEAAAEEVSEETKED